jgi:hypothetical protein
MEAAMTTTEPGRNTEIGVLSERIRLAVKKTLAPLAILLVGETAYLSLMDRPGASAFALIGMGVWAALALWCTSAVGLPLLPIMVAQSLIIYGVPIAAGHDIILTYPSSFVLKAGLEVMIFDLAMIFAWMAGMQVFQPSPPVSYAMREFDQSGVKGWSRLGFGMVLASTAFLVLQSFNLTDPVVSFLPNGSSSIIAALVSVVSTVGFFLVSMTIGARQASRVGKAFFWALLIANGMLAASELFLFSVAASLITVAIGFFWSSGKVPWRYLVVSMLCLSFLNTGKTTMRERYWSHDLEPAAQTSVPRLPQLYTEWVEASYNAVLENRTSPGAGAGEQRSQDNKNQTLLDRIDNLQNLLFVIDAVDTMHVSLLHGATYELIPPLLVPRILNPDKPRSHQGQVLLNVHFGRQDLNSTFETYIAWGLLPEAYGNFGEFAGSLCIGIFLGLCFAWVEKFTVRKPMISLEGFLSLSLMLNLMNSFEMVSSVFVTSTFQSFLIIVVVSLPFVRRTVGKSHRPRQS